MKKKPTPNFKAFEERARMLVAHAGDLAKEYLDYVEALWAEAGDDAMPVYRVGLAISIRQGWDHVDVAVYEGAEIGSGRFLGCHAPIIRLSSVARRKEGLQ